MQYQAGAKKPAAGAAWTPPPLHAPQAQHPGTSQHTFMSGGNPASTSTAGTGRTSSDYPYGGPHAGYPSTSGPGTGTASTRQSSEYGDQSYAGSSYGGGSNSYSGYNPSQAGASAVPQAHPYGQPNHHAGGGMQLKPGASHGAYGAAAPLMGDYNSGGGMQGAPAPGMHDHYHPGMPPQHGNLQAGYPQANNGQPHSTYEAQWQQFQTSAAGQVGMQFANQALKQGHDMVQSSVGRWLSFATLKYYFNVSNGYVLSKCGLLLFPFRHKTWTRVPRAADQQGHMQQWLPPRDDINAPDLYIPTMALITYVLISAVLIGSTTAHTSGFSPDIIGKLTSTGVGVVLTEALIVRFGCYLLGVQLDIPLLDLVSYAGYKFIGVIVAEIVRFFASFTLTYVVFGYTMLALGFFSLRTMRHIILPETTQTMVHQGRKRRINFMLGIAGLQIVLAWILMA